MPARPITRRALALVLALCACGRGHDEALIASHTRESVPDGLIALDARFDDALVLLGYLLAPRTLTHDAGSTVGVTLVWRVDGRLGDDVRPFTHLYDEHGRFIANLDRAGPFRRALAPGAWRWPIGRYVIDPLEVTLPPHVERRVVLAAGVERGTLRLDAQGGAVDARDKSARIALGVRGGRMPEVPRVEVPHRGGAHIIIDGKSDEPAWRKAASTGVFVHVASAAPGPDPAHPDGATSGPGASARLLWDEGHLYLAFEVLDQRLRGGFAEDARDPQLWTRDTVEIMIDPDGDGDNRAYYEIQVNPQNLVFDSFFDDYNQPRGGPDGPFGHQDWSSAIESAVVLGGTLGDDADRDEGYAVEARLPWRSLHRANEAPPSPGASWRMNFYAIDNNGPGGRFEAVAWSPILGQGNFHRAARFGRVTFAAPPDSHQGTPSP
jgi:hypothetical protein